MTRRARQSATRDAAPPRGAGPARAPERVPRRLLATGGIALALVALAFAVYANSLANDFVIDDAIIILHDERVRTGDWRAIVSQEYWPGSAGNRLYRPLPMLTFALNAAVSTDAVTFRVPNVLLHALAAFALYLLARDACGKPLVGAIAATLFVVHPIHTAPLNAIVDRAELLAAAFGLLGLWLVWRDAAPDARRSFARRAAAALCLALALFSKEHAVGLWLIAFVIVPWIQHRRAIRLAGAATPAAAVATPLETRRRPPGPTWPRGALLLLVLAVYLAARGAVLGGLTRDPGAIARVDNPLVAALRAADEPTRAAWLRVATPVAVFGLALQKLVWPWPLSWDYSYAAIDVTRDVLDPHLWLGGAALGALAALAWASARRRGGAMLAVALLVLPYAPVSNTLVLIGTLFAERFLYLPSAGFCFLLGLCGAAWVSAFDSAPHAARRRAAGGAFACGAAVAIAFAALTVLRNRDWRDDATLNAADLRTQPRSARLWAATATAALNARRFDDAIERADRARAIDADFPTPHRVAGLARWQLARAPQATPLPATSPTNTLSDAALANLDAYVQRGGGHDEQTAIATADLLAARGDAAHAIRVLEAWIARQPRSANARNNLAWLLITAAPESLRDPLRAIEHARAAVALAPGAGDYVDTYVDALLAAQRRDEARRELDRLLPTLPALDPYREILPKKLAGR
ncbi:MAG: hypothetical protein AB7Q17_09515 [Phycisphaerae bacterium]